MIDTQPINHIEEGEKITLSRVCQHLIRNCDKTRLRKKAGLPEEEEEGGEGEEGAAKEWTQARNLDEEVEGGGEREVDKVEEGEEEDREVEREVEKVGDEEDGEGQKREEAP